MTTSSLDAAKNRWMELGYGMFIHFGVNTFSGIGWGDGKFPAWDFAPDHLEPRQWAEIAVEAGMKYAVLTAKHHDGFCLWPSSRSEYSVKNSRCGKDVVALFVEAFRKAGLQVGLYYSLWDRNFPDYENDSTYITYMKAQLTELLSNYGPMLELWFDGGWDKDHPSRKWPYNPTWESDPDCGLKHGERWGWPELYELIHKIQPDCLVIQNSSSDRPGIIKYPPVDIRTSEHFDFIWNNQICKAENGHGQLPLEYCASITTSWFWHGGDNRHASAVTIADWLRRARDTNANLLLNIGPDKHGLLPEYHRAFLKDAARPAREPGQRSTNNSAAE